MGNKWFHNPSHPVWRIGTILAVTSLVISVNFFNANQFDRDDWERIGQILLGLGGVQTVKSYITKGTNG
jgi:hypothetical protein